MLDNGLIYNMTFPSLQHKKLNIKVTALHKLLDICITNGGFLKEQQTPSRRLEKGNVELSMVEGN